MVIAFIFLLHIVFIIYVFIKRTKKDSIKSALIDLTLIIILFSIGWSLSTMITKLFFGPSGFGKHFDRDTISLTLLTITEFFFYKMYFKDMFTSDEMEKQ
ncbi:MAG: hypothetical protein CR986_04520 [Ignavibacteriae bacterium]|nr:MAG: hypothetical protein CR986_04520 [Ignavibacteriota bacterium]